MKITAIIAILAAVMIGCQKAPQSVPRQKAYPRMALADTAMRQDSLAPKNIRFLTNAQAESHAERPGWLTITYPNSQAKIFVTFTSTTPSEIEAVKANRLERLILNQGNATASNKEFINPQGFSILVSETCSGTMPLQFIATDQSKMVISGAVTIPTALSYETYDSLQPLINALKEDVYKTMNDLGWK